MRTSSPFFNLILLAIATGVFSLKSTPTDAPVTPPTDAPVTTNAPVTSAPINSPTESPVIQPTNAPVTDAPVIQPTDAPIITPTDAPVTPPTDAPVTTNAPVTSAPTNSPTESPVIQPTNAPVTDAPVIRPTDAPVSTPTNDPTAIPTGSSVDPPTKLRSKDTRAVPDDAEEISLIRNSNLRQSTPALNELLFGYKAGGSALPIGPHTSREQLFDLKTVRKFKGSGKFHARSISSESIRGISEEYNSQFDFGIDLGLLDISFGIQYGTKTERYRQNIYRENLQYMEMHFFQTGLNEARQNLTEFATRKLENVQDDDTADEFVELFGSHFVWQVTYGAFFKRFARTELSSYMTEEKFGTSLNLGIGGSATIGANFTTTVGEGVHEKQVEVLSYALGGLPVDETSPNSFQAWKNTAKYYPAVVRYKLDPIDEVTEDTEKAKWLKRAQTRYMNQLERPPSGKKDMKEVYVSWIYCDKIRDNNSGDEIVIKVDGETVWPKPEDRKVFYYFPVGSERTPDMIPVTLDQEREICIVELSWANKYVDGNGVKYEGSQQTKVLCKTFNENSHKGDHQEWNWPEPNKNLGRYEVHFSVVQVPSKN